VSNEGDGAGRPAGAGGVVRVLHVVAKSHLDLGFTALAAEVEHRYLTEFVPRALAVADELRRRGGPERLVWTTGSWIVHRALADPDTDRRAAVAAGVDRGDLTWHALPVTTHTELMDADLVRAGLGISGELDARFDRTGPDRRTVAAKMTDVPGHTRGLVPLLAEAGVTFLHLGVNPAWPIPDVPPVFRWRSPDGAEVVVAYQAGGYGGTVTVPGCADALAFVHAGDNAGPPSADEVVAAHAALAQRFPGAEVRGSTLDAFARALTASGAVDDLPVVTAEIGDPWLFGAASDPAKLAAFRHLLRTRTAARARLEADGEARRAALIDVDRTLLLVAEHTWGLDQKEALPDTTRWNRTGLAELRATPAAERFEASWAEQRAYVDRAAALLAPLVAVTPLRSGVPEARGVDLGYADSGGVAIGSGDVVDGGAWALRVDPVTGAIVELVETATGRVLADTDHPLGLLRYQSFDAADYERYHAGLTPSADDAWWARWDNTKPGIDAVAEARSGLWSSVSAQVWHATHQGGAWHDLRVRVRFDPDLSGVLGAPPEAWMRWRWAHDPDSGGHQGIDVTLRWAEKPANRLPEALWWSFTPVVAEPERWTMDKLGQPVSPLDVVRCGGRSLHAVGHGGLTYDGSDGPLHLRTTDAPLVAPGRPNLLDADPPVPDLAGGWHVLLADNCWGTNFPMWIEGSAQYRITLST
jgi:hypothetical protein